MKITFFRDKGAGWDHRYLLCGPVTISWSTILRGEPFDGAWFRIYAAHGRFAIGTRWGGCAVDFKPSRNASHREADETHADSV